MSELNLWVDPEHIEQRRRIDSNTGEVSEEEFSAVSYCEQLGIDFRVLTKPLKEIALQEVTKSDGSKKLKILGDLGPFILCRIEDGELRTRYSALENFSKPMKLSTKTVRELARIFGNSKTGYKPT